MSPFNLIPAHRPQTSKPPTQEGGSGELSEGQLHAFEQLVRDSSEEELCQMIQTLDLEQVQVMQYHLHSSGEPELKLQGPRLHLLLKLLSQQKIELSRSAKLEGESKIAIDREKSFTARKEPKNHSMSLLVTGCLSWLTFITLNRLMSITHADRSQIFKKLSVGELLHMKKQLEAVDSSSSLKYKRLLLEVNGEGEHRLALALPLATSSPSSTNVNAAITCQVAPLAEGEPSVTQLWLKIMRFSGQMPLQARRLKVLPESPTMATIRQEKMSLIARLSHWLLALFTFRGKSIEEKAREDLAQQILSQPGPSIDISHLSQKGHERVDMILGVPSLLKSGENSKPAQGVPSIRKERFGMTISSSVVANQRERSQMSDALGETREQRQALRSVMKDKEGIFGSVNIFRRGGMPTVATRLELQSLDEILMNHAKSKISKKVSKNLSGIELERIQLYRDNLVRSEPFNDALFELRALYSTKIKMVQQKIETAQALLAAHLTFTPVAKDHILRQLQAALLCLDRPATKQWEGLKEAVDALKIASMKSLAGDEKNILEEAQSGLDELLDLATWCKREPRQVAQAALRSCKSLESGQALFLDSIIDDHAMRLAIKKEGDEFVITAYDSSGALERASLARGPMGLIHLHLLESGKEIAPRSNALSIRVSALKFYAEGSDYLQGLLYMGTGRGIDEQREVQKQIVKSVSSGLWPRFVKWVLNKFKLAHNYEHAKARQQIYLTYIEKLCAIAPKGKPARFLSVKQSPQITRDCYAHRIQTNQFYDLGIPLFKKLHQTSLFQQRVDILAYLKSQLTTAQPVVSAYGYDALKQPPVLRTHEELIEISRRLVHLGDVPSPAYFQSYYTALLEERAKIEVKLTQFPPQSTQHNEALIARGAIDQQMQRFYADFKRHIEAAPVKGHLGEYITGSEGALSLSKSKHEAFFLFLSDRAWADVLSILNHNIMRLDADHRYLNDLSERLPEAGLGTANKASSSDLESVNLVSYIKGLKRKKVYAVEIAIQGKRCELASHHYFDLLAAHPETLTHDNVIEISQYLRSSSVDLRAHFDHSIFKPQIQAFRQKLKANYQITHDLYQQQLTLRRERLFLVESHLKQVSEQVKQTQELIEKLDKKGVSPLAAPHRLLSKRLQALSEAQADSMALVGQLSALTEALAAQLQKITLIKDKTLAEISEENLNLAPRSAALFQKFQSRLEKAQSQLQTMSEESDHFEDSYYIASLAKAKLHQSDLLATAMQIEPSTRLLYDLCSASTQPHKGHSLPPIIGSTDQKIREINSELFLSTHDWYLQRLEDRAVDQWANLASQNTFHAHLQEVESAWIFCETDRILQELTTGLPSDVSDAWTGEMISLWMEKESLELIAQAAKGATPQVQLRTLFIQWVEKHTLKSQQEIGLANLHLDLPAVVVEKLKSHDWSDEKALQSQAAQLIQKQVRTKYRPHKPIALDLNVKASLITRSSMIDSKRPLRARTYQVSDQFSPDCKISPAAHVMKLFLEYPRPLCPPKGVSDETLVAFYHSCQSYFSLLQRASDIDFARERVWALGREISQAILIHPKVAPSREFVESLLVRYSEEVTSGSDEGISSIHRLDNHSRTELLNTVATLTLACLAEQPLRVLPSAVDSLFRQWANLDPQATISALLSSCQVGETPGELETLWQAPLKIGLALRRSSIGLECVHEGVEAIQAALYDFQKLNPSASLRDLNDKWSLSESKGLSLHMLKHYYRDLPETMPTHWGTVAGREFFERRLQAAYHQATPLGKEQLRDWIKELLESSDGSSTTLRLSHRLFLTEQLMQISSEVPSVWLAGSDLDLYSRELERLIHDEKPEEVLFGLAAKCHLMALQYRLEKARLPADHSKIDGYLSEMACSRLAFEQLYQKTPQEVQDSFASNAQFSVALEKMRADMRSLETEIDLWMRDLTSEVGLQLKRALQRVVDLGLIGSELAQKPLLQPHGLFGFTSLSASMQWDLVHGALYYNGYRTAQLLPEIRWHPDALRLNLQNLPFERQGEDWIYRVGGQPQVRLRLLSSGSLAIQRYLSLGNQQAQWLEYKGTGHSIDLPAVLTHHMGVHQFWGNAEGLIYGLDETYETLLTLKLDRATRSLQIELAKEKGAQAPSALALSDDLEGAASEVNDLQAPKAKIFSPTFRVVKAEDLTQPPLALLLQQVRKITSLENLLINEVDGIVAIPLFKLHFRYEAGNWICLFAGKDRVVDLAEGPGLCLERLLSPGEASKIKQLESELQGLKAAFQDLTASSLRKLHEKRKLAEQLDYVQIQLSELKGSQLLVAEDSDLEQRRLKSVEETYLRVHNQVTRSYRAWLEPSDDKGLKAWKEYSSSLVELQSAEKALALLHQSGCLSQFNSTGGDVTGEKEWEPTSLFSALQFMLGSDAASFKTRLSWLVKPLSLPLDALTIDALERLIQAMKERPETDPDGALVPLVANLLLLKQAQSERLLLLRGHESTSQLVIETLVKSVLSQLESQKLQPSAFLSDIQALWNEVKVEVDPIGVYESLFTRESLSMVSEGPLLLTFDMDQVNASPAKALQLQSHIDYQRSSDPLSQITASQQALMDRLKTLACDQPGAAQSLEQQESGFYREEFGLFDARDIARVLGAGDSTVGMAGLNRKDASHLLAWMDDQGWLINCPHLEKWQVKHVQGHSITTAPSFSKHALTSYFLSQGHISPQIEALTWKLEQFFLQMSVNSGKFSVNPSDVDLVQSQVTAQLDRDRLAYLEAEDVLRSTFECPLNTTTWQLLRQSYLTDDYTPLATLLDKSSEGEGSAFKLHKIKNAMTRWLYHQTETHHLQDIVDALKAGNPGQLNRAGELLQMARNYPLAKLLQSPPTDQTAQTAFEAEQKMQRAFLLFEWQFTHRCLPLQVEIFKGLLLDDAFDPEKIDAAQARMGFGKTSFLPLLALYKADGTRLVKFIVPKSALETNARDLTVALTQALGKKAIIDHFYRYQIPAASKKMGALEGDRLKALKEIQADLLLRKDLYHRVLKDKCVLIQAPYVRHGLEDQLKIFLDLLPSLSDEEERSALCRCIHQLNEIRSLRSVLIFDELDATQDPMTTDVNYTLGEKVAIDSEQILPLEAIVSFVAQSELKDPLDLAKALVSHFQLPHQGDQLSHYIAYSQASLPPMEEKYQKLVLLCRAVVCEGSMIALIREKEAGTDYGVWFQKEGSGSRSYDQVRIQGSGGVESTQTLLIAVPYSTANEPKPRGSRFDNPQVTAIATFRYYLDNQTALDNETHLGFVIDSLREPLPQELLTSDISPDFLQELQQVSEREDVIARRKEQAALFKILSADPQSLLQLRVLLARLVIAQQIHIDLRKATSDRYEMGNLDNQMLGFSGTAGETSFLFQRPRLDPAADGKVLLAIMGRESNQKTYDLVMPDEKTEERGSLESYNRALIRSALQGCNPTTRALIDVGGKCKTSNFNIAKILLKELYSDKVGAINSVLFVDDVSNTQKIVTYMPGGSISVRDATDADLKRAETDKSLFVFYDQAHSRGTNFPLPDDCHALMLMGFGVSLNDYKQALLRLRKIVDPLKSQAVSIALPSDLKKRVIGDLKLTSRSVTGNDIALWLRSQELEAMGSSSASLFKQEMTSIIRNCALQQQAALFAEVYAAGEPQEAQIDVLANYVQEIHKISAWINQSTTSLLELYGQSVASITKEAFLHEQRLRFDQQLHALFTLTEQCATSLGIETPLIPSIKRYEALADQAQAVRAQIMPSQLLLAIQSDVMMQSQVEVQSQAQAQSIAQVQSQAHTQAFNQAFSQVQADEPFEIAHISIKEKPHEAANLDFLLDLNPVRVEELIPLSRLFKGSHVHASSAFKRRLNHSAASDSRVVPLPPVRFVLLKKAALEATGLVIKEEPAPLFLVDQEEAELFLEQKSLYPDWVLFDAASYGKSGQESSEKNASSCWLMEKGELLVSADESLQQVLSSHALSGDLSQGDLSPHESIRLDLHRILFAAYQLPVAPASSLDKMALHYSGICERGDLDPHLVIATEAGNAPYFDFSKWGYSGKEPCQIDVEITQTYSSALCIRLDDKKQVKISKSLRERAALVGVNKGQLWLAVEEGILVDLEKKRLERADTERHKQQLLQAHRGFHQMEAPVFKQVSQARQDAMATFQAALKESFRKKAAKAIDSAALIKGLESKHKASANAICFEKFAVKKMVAYFKLPSDISTLKDAIEAIEKLKGIKKSEIAAVMKPFYDSIALLFPKKGSIDETIRGMAERFKGPTLAINKATPISLDQPTRFCDLMKPLPFVGGKSLHEIYFTVLSNCDYVACLNPEQRLKYDAEKEPHSKQKLNRSRYLMEPLPGFAKSHWDTALERERAKLSEEDRKDFDLLVHGKATDWTSQIELEIETLCFNAEIDRQIEEVKTKWVDTSLLGRDFFDYEKMDLGGKVSAVLSESMVERLLYLRSVYRACDEQLFQNYQLPHEREYGRGTPEVKVETLGMKGAEAKKVPLPEDVREALTALDATRLSLQEEYDQLVEKSQEAEEKYEAARAQLMSSLIALHREIAQLENDDEAIRHLLIHERELYAHLQAKGLALDAHHPGSLLESYFQPAVLVTHAHFQSPASKELQTHLHFQSPHYYELFDGATRAMEHQIGLSNSFEKARRQEMEDAYSLVQQGAEQVIDRSSCVTVLFSTTKIE